MRKQVLITGGAGFIGSHLSDILLTNDYNVRILDNLDEQVHGAGKKRPEYLNPDIELIVGDVRNKEDVQKALTGVDIVYHFAAKVGVGQSMYEIAEYTQVNNFGTAVLLENIVNTQVSKLIVASSMSIYGEGLYRDSKGNITGGHERDIEDLRQGRWEMFDSRGKAMEPVKTDETKQPVLNSIYALSKYDQERMCLITGRAYNLPVTALRFFNVYGTRQALSNPYTGVMAIFASRYLNEKPPLIFEDGRQIRDFVHVKDVAQACLLAAEKEAANGQVFNIGSGNQYSISTIASELATVMNKKNIEPQVTGKYRAGDIRHCFSDIEKARKKLGYQPRVDIKDGLLELADWLKEQIAYDHVDTASQELEKRGLTV